jgi:hypothetical protein
MGHHTPYSFSGGPENYGFCFFGNLVSRAGPWEGETQDYKFYHLNRPDARRTVTIINDDNPDFEGTVNAFQAIDSFIMAKPRQDYGPLPSEFHFWCGGTANSNTWCRYMLKQNPYEYRGGIDTTLFPSLREQSTSFQMAPSN